MNILTALGPNNVGLGWSSGPLTETKRPVSSLQTLHCDR